MKSRDQLAVQVMRAIIEAQPETLMEKSSDDGSDVAAVLDVFKEARDQIRRDFEPGYFPDDESAG